MLEIVCSHSKKQKIKDEFMKEFAIFILKGISYTDIDEDSINITKEETFTITYQKEEINKNKTENKTNKKQVNTSTITNSSRYGFMMLISIVSIVCLLKKRK